MIFFGIVGGVLWLNREQLGQLVTSGLLVSPSLLAAVAFATAFIWLILYLKRRQARGHVETLNYAITDRRVLIVRQGEVYESVTPDKMSWVELVERPGAEGYNGIIWDRRRLRHSSDSTPNSNELERSRVGVKALRDGPAVMERLEAWRAAHAGRADAVAEAALDTLQSGAEVPRLAQRLRGLSHRCAAERHGTDRDGHR